MATITDMAVKKPVKTQVGSLLFKNALNSPSNFSFDQLQIGDQVFNKSDNFAGLGELAGLGASGTRFAPGPGILKTPPPPEVTLGVDPTLQDSTGAPLPGVFIAPETGATIDTRDVNGIPSQFSQQDIDFEANLMATLDAIAAQEAATTSEYETAVAATDADVQAKLDQYSLSLDKAFAPKIAAIQQSGEEAQKAAMRSAGLAGSARGSRAAEKQQKIIQQTADAVAAAEAEKAAQLMLAEAEFRGAAEGTLSSLKERLNSLSDIRRQKEGDLELAKRGLLDEQVAQATAAQEAMLASYLETLKAQGLAINPYTNETVSTLEGEKLKAEIANKDAATAKIYQELQKPNVDVKYYTDELGYVTASFINMDTGESSSLELGKLDTAQKWALEALNAPSYYGGGGSSGYYAGGGDYLTVDDLVDYAISEGATSATIGAYIPKMLAEGLTQSEVQEVVKGVIAKGERLKPKSSAEKAGEKTSAFLGDVYKDTTTSKILGGVGTAASTGFDFLKGLSPF